MTTGETKLLFSWDDVDSLPEMRRLRLVLDWLPDGPAIEALRARRGRGRDDYPVEAMWRALVAGMVFQHASMGSLLRELGRNPGLLSVCGFDPLPRQGKPWREVRTHPGSGAATVVEFPRPARSPVPNAWNFSRFLESLERVEADTGCVTGMIDALREGLREALPDFGVHLGYDGKLIGSHSTGRTNRETGRTSDPEADWGKHETRGVDAKTGKAWTKVKSWFGYGLHLIADTRYENPVAFEVTHVGLHREGTAPSPQRPSRLFFGHCVAAVHHQPPHGREQLRRQQRHVVDHRLQLVAAVFGEIPVRQHRPHRAVVVRQIVQTVEIATHSVSRCFVRLGRSAASPASTRVQAIAALEHSCARSRCRRRKSVPRPGSLAGFELFRAQVFHWFARRRLSFVLALRRVPTLGELDARRGGRGDDQVAAARSARRGHQFRDAELLLHVDHAGAANFRFQRTQADPRFRIDEFLALRYDAQLVPGRDNALPEIDVQLVPVGPDDAARRGLRPDILDQLVDALVHAGDDRLPDGGPGVTSPVRIQVQCAARPQEFPSGRSCSGFWNH